MIADLIAAGLQLGWSVLINPAVPATCGQDIEVPCITLYEKPRRVSVIKLDALANNEKAASMFTPGAVTSGWNKKIKTIPINTN